MTIKEHLTAILKSGAVLILSLNGALTLCHYIYCEHASKCMRALKFICVSIPVLRACTEQVWEKVSIPVYVSKCIRVRKCALHDFLLRIIIESF